MEKSTILGFTDSSSSDSPLHSCSSLRLQSVSEMDMEMKAIMMILEEDGQKAAFRIGTNQNRKQQIIHVLDEYNRSYQSLAEKYEYLRSILIDILRRGSSSSSNAEEFSHNELERTYANFKSIDVDSRVKCSKENLIRLRDEFISRRLCNENFDKIVEVREHPEASICENTWNELNSQVTILMQENLQRQEELVKRNDEKREFIKELQQQIECLKSENRALQISLRLSREELKPRQSSISRLSDMISKKIMKLGCS